MTGGGRFSFQRIVVPTPFAVGPANVYVIADGPVTLIDCGPNTPEAENALVLGLAGLGLHPEQISRIVISHGHPDHYGLASRLQALSGAEVLVGELDLPKLASDRSMLVATGRLLLGEGMPMETLLDMDRRGEGMRALHPAVVGATALRGGEHLAFGGFDLEVLHLPGHTAGHVCLYEPDSGVLFSGDTLLLDVTPNPLLEPDPLDPTERRHSLVEYLRTLDRLSELELTRVFPGHGKPIEDPHRLIEDMRAHHRRRTEDLAGRLTTQGKTGWQLANEVFPALEGFDNFLAVSEVVAHVDLLVQQGRAQPVVRDGVTHYRLPDGS
jgi:glyoxylase-like metal-dependent hydrolase (beta-lactamase superfamily II)